MRKQVLLVAITALGLVSAMGIGQASESHSCSNTTHSCTASDTNSKVIEPIQTRSSALPMYTEGLGNANIQSYTISASGGHIKATINTKSKLVRNVNDVASILPYSGQHVMVMFQTNDFQTDQVIGKDATGADVTWGPPGFNADGFRWFLYYGWNTSELRDLCGLGYYDPTGELVPPAPVAFGQTFFVVGQDDAFGPKPTATCSFSNGDKTVTIDIPFKYSYHTRTNTDPNTNNRTVQVVAPGESVNQTSAFSWLDHEIGGPDPVGLILGWTWYTDAVPASSYRLGLITGDPNVAVVAGPRCYTNLLPPDPTGGTLYPAPGPCAIANPVGPGFINTNLNFVAG